jgi:hypothetical protein
MAATRMPPMVEKQRAEEFVALGFTTTQSFLLAATRTDGTSVEKADVERMLAAGCTHDTAVRILL